MAENTRPSPTFEQSNKPIRLGSEVIIDYGEDVDVGMVTGINQSGVVHVAVAGHFPKPYGAEQLAPFEEQDMEETPRTIITPGWGQPDIVTDERVEWCRNCGRSKGEHTVEGSYRALVCVNGYSEFDNEEDVS